MSFLTVAARTAVAAPFFVQGLDALSAPHNHRERAALFAPVLAALGINLDEHLSDASTRALGAAYIAGSTALATGIFPRVAAAGLSLAHVPVTLANNQLWRAEGAQRRRDAIGLAQGVAMIGGAILAARATKAAR